MPVTQERVCQDKSRNRLVAVLGAFLLSAGCSGQISPQKQDSLPEVRIGAGEIRLEELIQNFTIESLARVEEDGRLLPRLAKGWTVSSDERSIDVELRPGVTFHDHSPVTSEGVAEALRRNLPRSMGAARDDIADIVAEGPTRIEIKLARPSRFAVEALETTITKPGTPGIGTAAFMVTDKPDQLAANTSYYLGGPSIGRISLFTYPSTRAAWAELLRGNVDMLYEVGTSARSSLEQSTAINVFPYTRHYQYVLLFNTRNQVVRAPEVRRSLNAIIDRKAFVRDAMGGYGLESAGPVWPRHWAAEGGLPAVKFEPVSAAAALKAVGHIRFRCLVSAADERVALVLKRQLGAIGVELVLEQRGIKENEDAVRSGDFDALLATAISGPSLLRPYDWWHSRGTRNFGKYSNASVDTALDGIRHASSDAEYQKNVGAFQDAIIQDPPAVFLAWDERARAVSTKFTVPAEPGQDMMGTLRLWQLSPGTATN